MNLVRYTITNNSSTDTYSFRDVVSQSPVRIAPGESKECNFDEDNLPTALNNLKASGDISIAASADGGAAVVSLDFDPSQFDGPGFDAPIGTIATFNNTFGGENFGPFGSGFFWKSGSGEHDWGWLRQREAGHTEAFFIRQTKNAHDAQGYRSFLSCVPTSNSRLAFEDSGPQLLQYRFQICGIQTGFGDTPEGAIGDACFFDFSVLALYLDSVTTGSVPDVKLSDIHWHQKQYMDAAGGYAAGAGTNDGQMDAIVSNPFNFGAPNEWLFSGRVSNGLKNAGADSGRDMRWSGLRHAFVHNSSLSNGDARESRG